MNQDVLSQLMATIIQRKTESSGKSYTNKLLSGGVEKIGSKILEEAAEVVDAAKKFESDPISKDKFDQLIQEKVAGKIEGTKEHIVYEIGDLVYHCWVLMAHFDIPLEALNTELGRRFGQSGLEEKAARKPSASDHS